MSDDIQPTPEDLALDPRELLAACEERIRCNWHDLPMFASASRTVAALCRRLIAAEADVAAAERTASAVVAERTACHGLYDDILRLCNYDPACGHPGVVDAVRNLVAERDLLCEKLSNFVIADRMALKALDTAHRENAQLRTDLAAARAETVEVLEGDPD